MDKIRSEAAQAEINAAGHEPSLIKLRPILIAGTAIILIIAGSMLVLSQVMRAYQSEERVLGKSRPTLYKDDTGQFPEPNLQRNTTEDMAKFRDAERKALAEYRWVDPKSNVVQIPIDRALEIVSERGLSPKDLGPKPTETKGK